MRTAKKPLKFYLIIFIFSVLLVAGYSIYMMVAKDATVSELYPLWLMPFIFTGFYYGSDVLVDKITKRKKKVNYESKFLDAISKKMRDSNEFVIEEFRKLQNNPTFQDDMKRAYQISNDPVTDTFKIDRLEKKYRKETLENRAMKFVVEYLRENIKLPESE